MHGTRHVHPWRAGHLEPRFRELSRQSLQSGLLKFDGGLEVPASASPSIVPPPFSDAHAIDPEEAFVAALSSCHVLWFLSIAVKRGYLVDSYADIAEGIMSKNADGRLAMTRVTLKPLVAFGGAKHPDSATLEALHHAAHEQCFIASSVRTEVLIQSRLA